MKKLLLTFIGVIFAITSIFSQSYIGMSKKDIMFDIKDAAMKIEKPVKDDKGFYVITAKFQNYSVSYSFTKEHICYFYIIIERYFPDNYFATCKYLDDRYYRAFDDLCTQNKKTDVWKQWNRGSWTYIWVVCNFNTGTQYTLYLPQENYEVNKYIYLQSLLSDH
jgi:hypothetical protein